jgi:hypothetical protein
MLLRVTVDQVNRYLFTKQHLAPGSRGKDALAVAKEIGPIRAAPALTPFLSLWVRVDSLRREVVESILYEQRTLVRVPAMQARLYVLPVSEYPAYYHVTRTLFPPSLGDLDALLGEARKSTRQGQRASSTNLAHRVLEVLSARGPLTAMDLANLLPILKAPVPHDPEHPEIGSARIVARLLPAMCAEGLIIRAQPRGGWRSDLWLYATISSWLPTLDLDGVTYEAALQQIGLSYIGVFGPVTVGDLSHWLGLPRSQVAALFVALSDHLAHVHIEGFQGEFFMLKKDVPSLLDIVAAPPRRSACLLPPRDSYAMAYGDSSRFLSAVHRERVYDRVGEALGTVWLDDVIAGLWWLHIKEERITVRFFEPMDPEALALVGEEARRLGAFLSFRALDIEIGSFDDEDESEEGIPIFLTSQ